MRSRDPSSEEMNECRDVLFEVNSMSHFDLILNMIMDRNDALDKQRASLAEIAGRQSWQCKNCFYDYETSGWRPAPEVCPRCDDGKENYGCILLTSANQEEIRRALMEARI